MVSSIGISIVIFATYAPQYNDPNGFGFPLNLWFDDEWSSKMQHEFQIMLVASWGDMISRLVFAFGLLQCMEAIKELLTLPATASDAGKRHVESKAPIAPAVDGPNAVVLSTLEAETEGVKPGESKMDEATKPIPPKPSDTPSLANPIPNQAKAMGNWLQRVVSLLVHVAAPAMFLVWGCALLVVHLLAESRPVSSTCSLPLKPWLSTKHGCSLVEINCVLLHSRGRDDAVETVWDSFDPRLMLGVITSFKTYNSTVAEWDEAAALTHAHHTNLRAIFLIRTSTTTGQVPQGLQAIDFPKSVIKLTMCVTNITSLPDDVDTKWPKGLFLTLDYSPFATVPDVITRLQAIMVSFVGAPLPAIPTTILEMPQLLFAQFGQTQIQGLPRRVNYINPGLQAMMLQYTNVTEFWNWIDYYAHYITYFPVRLFNAYDTPYCRDLLEIVDKKRVTFSVVPAPDHSVLMDVSTPEKLAFVMRSVECTTPGTITYFPLQLEDAKYALGPVSDES